VGKTELMMEETPPRPQVDIDLDQFTSLWDLVNDTVNRFPQHPAYFHLGTTLTYQQLDQLSDRFAASLQLNFGIGKGDRVALMLPNILTHPVSMFGILRAGATVVNINPLFTGRELQLQLEDSGAKVLIALENCTRTLPGIIDDTPVEHIITVKAGDLHGLVKGWTINMVARYIKGLTPARGLKSTSFSSCLNKHIQANTPVNIQHDDIAYLQYTGGTTGTPKAAMLSHGNIIANTLQAYSCIKRAFELKNPYVVTALPLYHIFALTANCFVVARLAGCSHLITNPRDMNSFIKQLKKTRAHIITGVDTLFSSMMKHTGFSNLDFSKLQLTLSGGMSVQRSTAERWHAITGKPIIEAYGLTEASPAITTNPVDSPGYTGTIGLPLPLTERSVRDEDGNPVGTNTPGELWARGPQVMHGYWNKPEETAAVLTEDGWLKTGDIVTQDAQGYLQVIDRKKDLIIISGFNVYPSEIEEVLCSHPEISEAGVVGAGANGGNETIKAFIVRNDSALTKKQVTDYCRENLAAYKIPKIIEFTDQLPKSNIGKILRRALR
jgi:long-chain acyl-CoA synthetase